MANISTKLYTQRPDLEENGQVVTYTREPKYVHHKYYEDKLAILVCQIKIWKAKGTDWFKIPKTNECLTIRECESVEIADSAKDLVNKAVIKFPRGTVINKSNIPNKTVTSGDKSGDTHTEQPIKDATLNGDIITTGTSQYKEDGVSTTSLAVNYDNKGLIDFNRSVNEVALLSPNDIAIGNRIEIRLGYAYSEEEFNKINSADNGAGSSLDVAFTGFITAISVNTPLEIECTNMAHLLASVSAPNVEVKSTITAKDFLDDDGLYHILKGTGITLSESSKKSEIFVSGGTITDNLSVADVLSAWGDSGILCMMDTKSDGSVELRVGLAYYAGQNGHGLPNNDKKYITYNSGNNTVKLIQFDWDVAQDKLSLKHNDKKYLAVEAHGYYTDNEHGRQRRKYFKLTLRKNPDSDDEGWIIDNDNDFQVVNKRSAKGNKTIKHRDGTTSNKRIKGHLVDRVDLSKYTVVTYMSTTPNISQTKLIEEAKQYWAKYNPNGISGSITIFGDLYIKPTEIVGLIDPRQPEKNGYYYVESVNTTFGINGYRRELTIPFKIATFSGPVQII